MDGSQSQRTDRVLIQPRVALSSLCSTLVGQRTSTDRHQWCISVVLIRPCGLLTKCLKCGSFCRVHVRHQSWTEDRRLCSAAVVLLGNRNELLHGKWQNLRFIGPSSMRVYYTTVVVGGMTCCIDTYTKYPLIHVLYFALSKWDQTNDIQLCGLSMRSRLKTNDYVTSSS